MGQRKKNQNIWYNNIVFDSVDHFGAHCSIRHFEDGNGYILQPDDTRVEMVEKNGLHYIRLVHIVSPDEINCMVTMAKPKYRPEILGWDCNCG